MGLKGWYSSNKFTFIFSHDYFTFSLLSSNLTHSFLSQLNSSYALLRKTYSDEKLHHVSNDKYINLLARGVAYCTCSPVTVENGPASYLNSHPPLRSISSYLHEINAISSFIKFSLSFSHFHLSPYLYSPIQQYFSKCGLGLPWWRSGWESAC